MLCIQVNEVYRYNNRRLSTTPIQINLTPPPNLIVSSITHPSTTFSGVLIVSTLSIVLYSRYDAGELINVRWVTKNIGIGITNVDIWHDRIYLSEDESRGKDVH